MSPADFVQAMGAAVVWPLLSAIVAFVGVLVVGVLLVQGRRVPVALGLLPLVVPPVVALALAWSASLSPEGAGVPASVGVRLLTFPMFTVPAIFLLLFAGVAGALSPDRHWRRAGARLLLAGLAPAALAVYAVGYDDWAWPGVRIAFYSLCALFFALAGLCRDGAAPQRPDAVGLAGGAYALVVGVGEGAGQAFMEFFLLLSSAEGRSADVYAAYFERAHREIVAPLGPWSALTVGLAVFAGAVSLAPVLRAPRRVGDILAFFVFFVAIASVAAFHLTPAQAVAWMLTRGG